MFSIYDHYAERILSTGRNSATKDGAAKELLFYLSAGQSPDELAELSKLAPDVLAARCGCKIFEHSRPYSDEEPG